IEERTRQVYDGAGGCFTETIKFPIWFEPVADGNTPMAPALELAYQVVAEFVQEHPLAFPPIVMNITDGQPDPGTEPEVESVANRLRNLATQDGQVLLFNAHISESTGQPILFPDSHAILSDQYARFLFRISSVLPPTLLRAARSMYPNLRLGDQARGFAYQADLVSVVQFLDIGTIATRSVAR
ncbi:MAG: hypothetical protein NZM42_14110, partial [Gemmatales bacterium]|nr:hypothetical protein [Gemmatales bacterium]